MTAPLCRFWSLADLRLPLSPLASMVRSSHAKPGAAMTGHTKLRSDRQAFGNSSSKTSESPVNRSVRLWSPQTGLQLRTEAKGALP